MIWVFSATESVMGIKMAAVAVELMNAPTVAAAPIIIVSRRVSFLPPRRMMASPTRCAMPVCMMALPTMNIQLMIITVVLENPESDSSMVSTPLSASANITRMPTTSLRRTSVTSKMTAPASIISVAAMS